MTCHIVCGGGETKPPCKFYTGKKRPKKGKDQVTNDEWKSYLKTCNQ